MASRHLVSVFVIAIFSGSLTITAADRNGNETNAKSINIPVVFQSYARSLGKRVVGRGKERTTYAGKICDRDGSCSDARVVHQFPNLVRLEGFNAQGTILSFDGKAGNGITSRKDDESVIESFSSDSLEGLLQMVHEGAAIRVIGKGYGPDPRMNPNYTGPRFDVYHVTGHIRCREDHLLRSKTYHFDSQTGFLRSTYYEDLSVSPPVEVETRFSMWGTIDGSAYPAKIEHYRGGRLIFAFIAEDIQSSQATDLSYFQE